MKKTKDTNKGITLIALVITIIVMLILVAVTITMAVNGGLFEYAGRAGTKTNTARDTEQEYANLQPNMTVNQLIDKYTGRSDDNGGGSTPTVRDCENCENGLIVGYTCDRYGYSCNLVSFSFEEVHAYYGCCYCFNVYLSEEFPGSFIKCSDYFEDSCDESFIVTDTTAYRFEACGHMCLDYSSSKKYPCPDCIKTVRDCENCTDGIIAGYRCGNYGCDVISSSCAPNGNGGLVFDGCGHSDKSDMPPEKQYYLCQDCTN